MSFCTDLLAIVLLFTFSVEQLFQFRILTLLLRQLNEKLNGRNSKQHFSLAAQLFDFSSAERCFLRAVTILSKTKLKSVESEAVVSRCGLGCK